MAERVAFERSLYSPASVERAAATFADYAKIALQQGEGEIVAEIEAAEGYDSALVVNTFANHVLHDTIAQRRQTALDEDE